MASYRNRIVGTADVDPTTLRPNPRNWRGHTSAQSAALKEVLSTVGWVTDVIVNKTTGNLIDGHLRVETAIKNHEKSIPVKYVELTEDEERMVLATFDPIAAMAEADEKLLQELVNSIPPDEIDLSKFDLGIDLGPKHTEEELEDVPPVPRVAKTKRGDMFRLGRHVLMCGDATDAADMQKLMRRELGVRADIAFTSPPYNAGHLDLKGDEATKKKYVNDDDSVDDGKYLKFLQTNLNLLREHAHEVFYNVAMLAGNKRTIIELMHNNIDSLKEVLFWQKTNAQPPIAEGVVATDVEWIVVFGENNSRRFRHPGFPRGGGTISSPVHQHQRINIPTSTKRHSPYTCRNITSRISPSPEIQSSTVSAEREQPSLHVRNSTANAA